MSSAAGDSLLAEARFRRESPDLAARYFGGNSAGVIVDAAKVFEAYLKGEAGE